MEKINEKSKKIKWEKCQKFYKGKKGNFLTFVTGGLLYFWLKNPSLPISNANLKNQLKSQAVWKVF